MKREEGVSRAGAADRAPPQVGRAAGGDRGAADRLPLHLTPGEGVHRHRDPPLSPDPRRRSETKAKGRRPDPRSRDQRRTGGPAGGRRTGRQATGQRQQRRQEILDASQSRRARSRNRRDRGDHDSRARSATIANAYAKAYINFRRGPIAPRSRARSTSPKRASKSDDARPAGGPRGARRSNKQLEQLRSPRRCRPVGPSWSSQPARRPPFLAGNDPQRAVRGGPRRCCWASAWR